MIRACFKSYAFRMRVKADTYNDETRLKHSVVDANELEWASYNKRLIQVRLTFFRSARASCTTSGEPPVRNENLDPMYTGIYAS